MAAMWRWSCVATGAFAFALCGSGCDDARIEPSAGALSVGAEHACALKADGSVVCWGRNHEAQARPPQGSFEQVSAGGSHSCGLATDRTVVCWGEDGLGQASPPSHEFVQVSAGRRFSCGVTVDGSAICWGSNPVGQAMPPSGSFRQVSAGESHACGVKTNGSVVCWGADDSGEATAPSGSFTQVSVGQWHSCGLKTDGLIACWGSLESQRSVPAGSFVQVTTGDRHSCAMRGDGSVACWGDDEHGKASAPAERFVRVSAGGATTCGTRSDGSHRCWGNNSEGQATPPGNGPPGSLEIGLDDYDQLSFVPVTDGAELPMYLGTGGLYVLVLSLRANEVDPDAPHPTISVYVDDTLVAFEHHDSNTDMVATTEGYVLWNVFVIPRVEMCCFNCRDAVVLARLDDRAGQSFEGEVRARLVASDSCADTSICCADAAACPDPTMTELCE